MMNDQLESLIQRALGHAYGLCGVDVARVHAGTATANFVISDSSGPRWFAKIYRNRSDLPRECGAIALAGFARAGGLPVPRLHRAIDGAVIGRSDDLALSLWDFVPAETAEGGLSGPRWVAVGTVVGHLHRRLASYPAVRRVHRPASGLCDLQVARARYDALIADYRRQRPGDAFQAWALEAAVERRSLLPRVQAILEALPALSTQVVHGDLATPNLLLRGNEVAAIVDFQPPARRYLSWEVARIGCDPRTIDLDDTWTTKLPELLGAYRDANPDALDADVTSVIAVGCAYTLASTYPLAEPLKNADRISESLEEYGRSRHRAALAMLAHLDS